MSNSKINQAELKSVCGAGQASINLNTGRVIFEHPLASVGANSHRIDVSLVHNSMFRTDSILPLMCGLNTALPAGWKLNVHQFCYLHDPSVNNPLICPAHNIREA